MAKLERIVNVQIALNTAGIDKKGFSTILVAGWHVNSLNRVDIVTEPDDMIAMGFSTDDAIYKAVSAGFSQTPKPAQIKIGRLSVSQATAVITAKDNTEYVIEVESMNADTFEITKQKYAYQNTNGNASTIANNLASQIVGITGLTAAANGDSIRFTIGGIVKVKGGDNIDIIASVGADAIANDMAKIKAEDANFYGIALASRDKDKIMQMAEYAETQLCIFGTSGYEAGIPVNASKNDVLSELSEKGYLRTHYWPHKKVEEWPEVAVMARCFAIQPGGDTWALKTLSAVTTDGWTETEAQAIFAKNGNTYEKVRNLGSTQNGKMVGGEWIDVIRFRDWLQEEIATDVFITLKNADKIPYTDGGIAIIENTVRACLLRGQAVGGIAPTEIDGAGNKNPGFTLTVPLSSDISANDKAHRVLNGIRFTARLAGAIHAVNITGSFTYNNLTTTDNVAV